MPDGNVRLISTEDLGRSVSNAQTTQAGPEVSMAREMARAPSTVPIM